MFRGLLHSVSPSYIESSRSQQDLFTVRVTVVGTIDEIGEIALHIRSEEKHIDHPSGKIIYLQCLSGCELEMDSVRTITEKFYYLLGDFKIGNNNNISLTPTVEVTDWLHIEDVHQNTVVLFGDVSKIIYWTRKDRNGYYAPISPRYQDSDCEPCRFENKSELLLENGHPCVQGVGRIALVRKDLEILEGNQTQIQRFRSRSKEHLSAFLAFHATGHNACIGHTREFPGLSEKDVNSMGYMSHAECIIQGYLGNAGLNCPCPYIENPYSTLESFVEDTMINEELNREIKEKIYVRYIK